MRSAFRLLAGGCLAVAVTATADGASAGAFTVRRSVSHHSSRVLIRRQLKLTVANNGTPIAASKPDAVSWTGTSSHASINLSASQSDTRSNTGGGVEWGDPLSTDLVNLGRIHTRLHYFSPSNGYETQQAVGIKLSIQY